MIVVFTILGVLVLVIIAIDRFLKWSVEAYGHTMGVAFSKSVILLAHSNNIDIKKDLEKIGISVSSTDPEELNSSQLPVIMVRYHNGFRIDDNINGCLKDYSDKVIERTLVIILHKSDGMGFNRHGEIQDPKRIMFNESESPQCAKYKRLLGIIHIKESGNKNIFENTNADKVLIDWIKQANSERVGTEGNEDEILVNRKPAEGTSVDQENP